ncbi:Quino protein alcohol dehydrogenase-like protein [Cryphonectria parasitica EP155]|uniref:Quino protein alcohol dehydrogenase-like protein n=1 Tax=Cryphonectria parasitica (strain ATCC 38755 / EP155) TaxID=660469 RepID=A0A9P4XUB3_CRYP1|nr:Quino protein alcohol dehydrogenase-like protein [Cryphonectria parasitica EP155]KAF3760917.1 Quino protein alcohol dehydrogenase-like protein [Cryphonectria parasitica EP155]
MSLQHVLSLVALCLSLLAPSASDTPKADRAQTPAWLGWGNGIFNNRFQETGSSVDARSASSLKPLCQIDYSPGVSAPPLVQNGVAYFPTWSGLLVALDYATCETVWQINITELIFRSPKTTGLSVGITNVSRTTPVIDGNVLYTGTQAKCLLLAIDVSSGQVMDQLSMHDHPFAILTLSPTFYNGTIYSGVSSQEEVALEVDPTYTCCSFKGTMNAVVFESGKLKIVWTQWMIPESLSGWSGAAIWGSQPSIQVSRSQLFIATGNTYDVPAYVDECQIATGNNTAEVVPDPCLPEEIYQESVVALDLATGAVNWVRHLGALDVYTVACDWTLGIDFGSGPPACDVVPGPDYDFGMAPTFIPASTNTPSGLDTVVVAQKSGWIFALSAETGDVLWYNDVTPGANEGGFMWGIAVDDNSVYYTAFNYARVQYEIQLSGSSNDTVNVSTSVFGALHLIDGKVAWQVPSPPNTSSIVQPTVVNDVVITGISGVQTEPNVDPVAPGSMLVLDKASGSILAEYALGNVLRGGLVPVDEYLLFGTGDKSSTGFPGLFNVYSMNQ